ncbi:hypothetical protein KBB96_09360 [Luteolibacter ambystomatis]|uniref:ATP-binding protein n=1 Tax=Luteolibacter ambystomatis TaxID=2824561 RepID=A0A975J323_9BACT|nr:hypothetical protein [Luteolibacter ambystomatis]QUE53086.1 hypothetical protein KBB96_09360 [Luteolibacter ambystomatis]
MNPVHHPHPSAPSSTGHFCPHCHTALDLPASPFLQNITPACDPCAARLNEALAIGQAAAAWTTLLHTRMPAGYRTAFPERVPAAYAAALHWTPTGAHPGGIGLIGRSGLGKSCAIACLLRALRMPFLWWSGTGARDAHLESVTADRDRPGARRRWEHGGSVPILILDDISQGKMTESWSSALFGLLESRVSAGLPTFWTCQTDLPALRAKIHRQNEGDMPQAQAITRRLAHHTLLLRS